VSIEGAVEEADEEEEEEEEEEEVETFKVARSKTWLA
jgi:hypothetical protein